MPLKGRNVTSAAAAPSRMNTTSAAGSLSQASSRSCAPVIAEAILRRLSVAGRTYVSPTMPATMEKRPQSVPMMSLPQQLRLRRDDCCHVVLSAGRSAFLFLPVPFTRASSWAVRTSPSFDARRSQCRSQITQVDRTRAEITYWRALDTIRLPRVPRRAPTWIPSMLYDLAAVTQWDFGRAKQRCCIGAGAAWPSSSNLRHQRITRDDCGETSIFLRIFWLITTGT